jgi:monothiol glutaredoxin
VPDYFSVDVLSDPAIREGIKEFGQWPTIPQLYVKGELVGGADIVRQMYASGELHQLLGVSAPDRTPPEITLTDAAAAMIRQHLPDPSEGVLQLSIDGQHQAGFSLAPAGEHDIVAESNGIAVHLDPGSAQRARGVVIDWIKTMAGEGLALSFPGSVKSMSVATLKVRMDQGDITLVDVRPAAARAQASIKGAVALEETGEAELARLPKDRAIVFHCHHGNSSRPVAERFVALGFTDVYNVEGGIDAWSKDVDPSVPRY